MSGFNGSGTFNISGVGLPYTSGTTISSSVANTLNTQLAAGLSNCITKDGQQILTANIPFGGYKITGLGTGSNSSDSASIYNIQCGTGTFISVTGTDTIVGTATPALTAGYVTGMTYRFFAAGANTGAVTLNISGQGAKAVTKNGTTALVAGDIPSGYLITVTYDGTQFVLNTQTTFGTLTATTLSVSGNATISGKLVASGGTLSGGNTLLGTYPVATSGFTDNGIAYLKNRVAVSTTLSAAITSTDLSIPLTSVVGFPTGGGTVLIDNEQITYASIAGSSLVVSSISNRGVNGTGVTTHNSGAAVSSATFGSTTLSSAIDNAVTTIPITSGTNFPAAGTVLIDSEQITYTGNTGTTLTGATRGANGTVAAAHLISAAVTGVQTVATSANLKYDDVTGALTVPNLTVTNSLYAPGVFTGYKNRIINGGMDIAQRGTSFVSPTATYTLDRWLANYSGAMNITITQDSNVPSNNEFQNSLKVAVTTADTSIGSTDIAYIQQKIEGYNVRDLIGQTLTVSFWVKSTITGTYCVGFANSTSDRSYVTTYTINTANTWEYKTITLPSGLITAGTWNWTNGVGLQVTFALAVGANYQTTANAWQTGNYIGTSAQVNAVSSTSNVFAITGVQLEKGAVATAYEHRAIGMEAELCQRYFQKTPSNNVSLQGYGSASGANTYAEIGLNVLMRATPTVGAVFSSGVNVGSTNVYATPSFIQLRAISNVFGDYACVYNANQNIDAEL